MEININYKVTYTKQDIDDILCAALEGGICYWCGEAEVVGEYLGEYASDQISRGGTLILHDNESDECYELTPEKFEQGLAKFLSERGTDVLTEEFALDTTEIDGSDADLIVQYALFGEVVYG